MRHPICSSELSDKKRLRAFFKGLEMIFLKYISWNDIFKRYLLLQPSLPKSHSLDECPYLSHIYTSFCLSHLSVLKPLMNFPPPRSKSAPYHFTSFLLFVWVAKFLIPCSQTIWKAHLDSLVFSHGVRWSHEKKVGIPWCVSLPRYLYELLSYFNDQF